MAAVDPAKNVDVEDQDENEDDVDSSDLASPTPTEEEFEFIGLEDQKTQSILVKPTKPKRKKSFNGLQFDTATVEIDETGAKGAVKPLHVQTREELSLPHHKSRDTEVQPVIVSSDDAAKTT